MALQRLTSKAPKNETRFQALDALRGLAAVAVVFFHIDDFGLIAGLPFFREARLFVDFFFVLSGFVIACAYGERIAGGYSRGAFLCLRFFRIYPLHLVMVLIYLFMELALIRPVLGESHDLFYLVRALFMLDGFWPSADNYFSTVSWSLSVEFVAYLIAALLFGSGRKGIAVAVFLVATASICLAFSINVIGFGQLLQRGIVGFGTGTLVFAIWQRYRLVVSDMVATIVEALVLLSVFLLLSYPPAGDFRFLACVPLFAMMVFIFAHEQGLFSRLLLTAPMLAVGAWSYSIYMVHLFIISSINRAAEQIFLRLGWTDLLREEGLTYGLRAMDLGPLMNTALSLAVCLIAILVGSQTFKYIEEPWRLYGKKLVKERMARSGGAAQAG
ncbi:acyltransferase [Alteraurantiacibacter aestuarii]|uniref:Acyltransferase family protein n=1 Tax=Alteraurantiacibacter aestuarii TaxID=650004 RepID=A0A844ZPD4_9SPHN|nr:acyltransferase [Alteraurantiacibacter aestuarii]MXO88890.1 acyltransferase family protein [Alteraurantiacibacter aestuarii]